jgi:hypothetical protein
MHTGTPTWTFIAALALTAGTTAAAAPGSAGGGRPAARSSLDRGEVTLEIERSLEQRIEPTVEKDPLAAPKPHKPPSTGGAAGGAKITPPGVRSNPTLSEKLSMQMVTNPALPARLSQKLVLNLALRYLLELQLTDAQLGAALPLLKEMRVAEQALEAECEQAIEAENQALLAARPGTPVPAENRERWRLALSRYQLQEAQLWLKVVEATSLPTANGLRALLGRGGKLSGASASVRAANGVAASGGTGAGGSGRVSAYAAAGYGSPRKLFGPASPGEIRIIRPDPATGLQPRLSLAELIDLLERKQQATPPTP